MDDLNPQSEIDGTIPDVDMDDDISDTDSTDTGARTISAEPEVIPGRWVDWSHEQRRQQELLFADQDIIKSPWNGWNDIEARLLAKDEQMIEYLVDFPCEKWLLGMDVAVPAYKAMMRRCHLRAQGFHAFPLHVPEDFWPTPLRSEPAPVTQVPQHLKPSPRNQAAAQDHYQPAPQTSFAASTQPVDVPGARYTWSDGPPPVILELAAIQQQPAQPSASAPQANGASTTQRASRSKKSSAKSPDKSSEESRQTRVSKTPVTPPEVPPPEYKVHADFPTHGDFEYPWLTDYAYEIPEAWDDSIYPPGVLDAINAQHAANKARVTEYARGGLGNPSKKRRPSPTNESFIKQSLAEGNKPAAKRPKDKKPQTKPRKGDIAGRLRFSSDEDQRRCEELGLYTVSEAVKEALRNPFNNDLAQIKVYNDPGDSRIEGLTVPDFSVMDFARTYLQLQHFEGHTLPHVAGERMIDFCPEMLRGQTIVRVTSQTDLIATDVQKRLGCNGAMLSDSTLTKRIGSACEQGGHKETNLANHKLYQEWFRKLRNAGFHDRPSTFDLGKAAEKWAASQPPVPRASPPAAARSRGKSTASAVAGPSRRPSAAATEATPRPAGSPPGGLRSTPTTAEAPRGGVAGAVVGASRQPTAATISPAPHTAEDESVIRVAMGPPSPGYTAARKRARSESTLSAASGDEPSPKRRA
ncbi:hypothetical protein MBLNU457_4846t1 [Dothideomycetes sp. NU457]